MIEILNKVPPQYQQSSAHDDGQDENPRSNSLETVPAFHSNATSSGTSSIPRSPPLAPTSNTGSNTGFQVIVVKLLTEMALEVKEVKSRVDHNTALLNDLNLQKEGMSVPEDPMDIDLDFQLQVQTVETLEEFEERLTSAEFVKKLLLKLSVLGGKDVQSTVKNLMSNLLAPSVAQQYNFTGAKGKKEFRQLELAGVILRAVHMNPRTQNAQKDDVKQALVSYLFNARDLMGGRRKRRANGQVVPATEE
ncbi:hypothetical protein HOLleu_05045 [Holothuria leucospilota]|uniref:DUF4806 domain-containing protein n=1 Tax=Holothuria leucospilota TaxID=206669 RepID=A0A9Q1CJD9_HOLLE|nr:hypothetical protein HOLleu_05045 [Holothuria leucospilota]